MCLIRAKAECFLCRSCIETMLALSPAEASSTWHAHGTPAPKLLARWWATLWNPALCCQMRYAHRLIVPAVRFKRGSWLEAISLYTRLEEIGKTHFVSFRKWQSAAWVLKWYSGCGKCAQRGGILREVMGLLTLTSSLTRILEILQRSNARHVCEYWLTINCLKLLYVSYIKETNEHPNEQFNEQPWFKMSYVPQQLLLYHVKLIFKLEQIILCLPLWHVLDI